MDSTTWKRAKQVFHEALEKSGPDRSGFVDSACGDDARLRAQVQALLKAHDEAGEFLASPTVAGADEAARAVATPSSSRPSERPGATIGPYKLLRVIGEGGFGVVYMAEQEEPVRRRVALKIIKLGMDTRQVIARFEAERQALALMEHPNIARVLDAGATETGRPYFVMELVKGVPITKYCDSNRMSTRERLDLFREICAAVQHAHQKGIIHRDIKPSNVLVTLHDGKPVPKVIDFGISKATNQRLTEKTLFTEYGQFIGTPAYMSPEQAEMSGLDVDTRSDIYSLGVLLYELLTGTTPFDAETLRRAGYGEIQRIIREVDPPTPSKRLSTLGGALAHVAKQRKIDTSGLRKLVRGELDWIVMKALEKERNRRYDSPAALADDIRRHRIHEPVLAGPPTASYRARKFVRRHRVGAGAAAFVFAALVVGFAAATYGLMKATKAEASALREATTAERVTEFLVGVFQISDPDEAVGNRITARQLLDAGTGRINVELTDQPLVRARLSHTMGRAYQGLGLYPQSEELLEGAFEARRRLLGADHLVTLETLEQLGELRARQSRYDEADSLLRRVIDLRERRLGPDDPATLDSRVALGRSYTYQERLDEAEGVLESALEAQRRVWGPAHPAALATATWLGRVYSAQARYADAESLLVATLSDFDRVLGPEHPETMLCEYLLADVYLAEGRYERAEPLFLENLRGRQDVLGRDHPDTLSTMSELGYVYMMDKRLEEAEPLLREVLETRRRIFGVEHRNTLFSMTAVGYVSKLLGRLDEAESLTREALAIVPRVLGPEHRVRFDLLNNLAEIRAAQGRLAEAETLFRETLDRRREALGPDHVDTGETLYGLAGVCRDSGRYEEALALYEEALAVLERHVTPDHWRVVQIRRDQAELKRTMERD